MRGEVRAQGLQGLQGPRKWRGSVDPMCRMSCHKHDAQSLLYVNPQHCCHCAPQENDKLRSLRSGKIGKLSQFVGTVTRTTEVGGRGWGSSYICLFKGRVRRRSRELGTGCPV